MKNCTILACMAMVTASTCTILNPLPECAVQCMDDSAIPLQAPSSACNNSVQIDIFEQCVNSKCTVREALTTKNISETICDQPLRDRTSSVSVTGIVGLSLATVTLLLRVISRARNHQFGMDDWTMITAMSFVVPLSALSVILANLGLGKDVWSIPFDSITYILQIYYVDEVLYIASLTIVKASVLCFYLRIFPRRAFRRVVYTIIAGNLLYGSTFILLSIFQCVPIRAAWTNWDAVHRGRCLNAHALAWANAAINICFDLIILILPLPELAKLAMTWERKSHVLLMFGLGSFVTIVSILRLSSLIRFSNTQNITWDYVPIGYWSTIEVHISVICASMPALPSLFRKRPTSAETQITQASLSYLRVGSEVKCNDAERAPVRLASVSRQAPSAGQIRVSSCITITSAARPNTRELDAMGGLSTINNIDAGR